MQPVKKYRQFIVAVTANLAALSIGTCIGWSSPIIPKLQDRNLTDTPLSDPIEKNSEEETWIISFVAISGTISPFLAGYLSDKIGRKWTIIASALFVALAYALLIFANKVWLIMLARFIQGIGIGMGMTVIPMYIGEISTNDCRGATSSLLLIFINGGILYSYTIGPYVSYKTFQIACLIIPIVCVISFVFMPESPYYFAKKGRKFEAIKSLKFLRGQKSEDVNEEISQILQSVEEAQQNKGSIMTVFTNKVNLKAFIICFGLLLFQQLSGIVIVLYNSETIFKDAKSSLDPAIATITIGLTQMIASSITPLIVDRWGRKPILLVSAAGMSLSISGLGVFFFIKSTGADISSIAWLPITSLIAYMFVYCIGFGPLPWAILGEMFAENIKSIATSMNSASCCIMSFIIVQLFPILNTIGTHYAFFLFGAFCIFGFFFVWFVVMETKGLSLAQIQEKLNKDNLENKTTIKLVI